MGARSRSGNNSEVVAACYEAALDPALWPEALRLAADRCAAESAVLTGGLRDTRCLGSIATGLAPETIETYQEHAWSSPLTAALRAAPLCTPVCDRLVMPRAEFESSAFYQNWVRPAGLAEGLVSALSPLGPDVIVLTLMRERTPRTRPFDEGAALRRFASLLPHFGRAAQIQRRLMQAQALPQGAGAAALEALSVAVLLLNARGKVLWANKAAETLLRARHGLIYGRDGVLTGASPADAARLRALVAAVSAGTGDAAPLGRATDMPPLLALGVPCVSQPDAWRDAIAADTVPHVALFVVDPSASLAHHGATAPAIRLRALFGLTAAEAAAALAVASGDGLPSVAQMFGVAPGTVRTHVKSVFAKMHIHSQVELARLLAQLGLIEAEGTT